MKHIKIFENFSTPVTIRLYVYECQFPEGTEICGWYAPNDAFMTSIFEEEYEFSGSGDFSEYSGTSEFWEEQVTYDLLKIIEFHSEEEIKAIQGLELPQDLDKIDPSATDVKNTGLSAKDLWIGIPKKTWRFLNFDPKEIADKYSNLTTQMREELIMALIAMQKYDPRGLFTRIK
jgi:hypothetical protein